MRENLHVPFVAQRVNLADDKPAVERGTRATEWVALLSVGQAEDGHVSLLRKRVVVGGTPHPG